MMLQHGEAVAKGPPQADGIADGQPVEAAGDLAHLLHGEAHGAARSRSAGDAKRGLAKTKDRALDELPGHVGEGLRNVGVQEGSLEGHETGALVPDHLQSRQMGHIGVGGVLFHLARCRLCRRRQRCLGDL